jgi:RHS repeat-associated protein
VTDISGNVTQHVEYVPLGEVFIEEHNASWKTPYKFNGKELDEETGLYYYGARYYDPRVSLWLGVDPLAEKYPNVGGYVYCVENPINAIDPDGKRVYFVAGAGLDTKGWRYTERWGRAFEKSGIKGFTPIRNVSHDMPGSFPIGDILFTTQFSKTSKVIQPTNFDLKGDARSFEYVKMQDAMVNKAVGEIIKGLKNNPLEKGEQLNLAGYSYGSVLQAQVVLKLSEKGYKVDNLILIGSPISNDSELYKELSKVTNIIRQDIPGDKLSNPSNVMQYYNGAIQNSNDDGPHFDLARPGIDTDKKIQTTVDKIKTKGIK